MTVVLAVRVLASVRRAPAGWLPGSEHPPRRRPDKEACPVLARIPVLASIAQSPNGNDYAGRLRWPQRVQRVGRVRATYRGNRAWVSTALDEVPDGQDDDLGAIEMDVVAGVDGSDVYGVSGERSELGLHH